MGKKSDLDLPTTFSFTASCRWNVIAASASYQYVAARIKNCFSGVDTHKIRRVAGVHAQNIG